MTEPTTPAGRVLLDTTEDAVPSLLDENRRLLRGLILAIEEQARAEGRREAAQEIREAVNTADHPSRTNDEIVALVRDAVARHGRSGDPTETDDE